MKKKAWKIITINSYFLKNYTKQVLINQLNKNAYASSEYFFKDNDI